MPIPRTRTTPLPGIGVQHGLTTQAGQHLSVIAHRDGSRSLSVYRRDDPDACAVSLHFTDEEAAVLADALTPGQRESGLVDGPLTARYTEPIAKRLTRRPARRAVRPETRPSGAGQPTAVLSDHPPGQGP